MGWAAFVLGVCSWPLTSAVSHSVGSESPAQSGTGNKIARKQIEVRRLPLDRETPASHEESSIHSPLVKSDPKSQLIVPVAMGRVLLQHPWQVRALE
jgi:hypothetical protein